ncbi:MAG: hypothetical protein ACR2JC_15300 [Chloroflexota bacterium]|nr:MAG: hypothetical protein DLM70_09780 [Chloroflexota bacterium]
MSTRRTYTLTNKKTGRTRQVSGREAARSIQRASPGIYKSSEYDLRTKGSSHPGLTKAQQRGHARSSRGESSISRLRAIGQIERIPGSTLDKYYQTVKYISQGDSLTTAARKAGTTPETVRRVNEEHQLLDRPDRTSRRWGIRPAGHSIILTSDGEYFPPVDLDKRNLSRMGTYWAIVGNAQNGKGHQSLARFKHTIIRDVDGNQYRLETDLNVVLEWLDEQDFDSGDFERMFSSENGASRAA